MAIRSVRVSGFTPTVNGLHFLNTKQSWGHEPDYIVNIAGTNVALGDASNGVCGGMAFTVKDLFDTGLLPPADTTNPAEGSPLFNYIVARLAHSFVDATKYLSWIQMTDGDSAVNVVEDLTNPLAAIENGITTAGMAKHEILEEWPQIQADLDGNNLSPLGLVAGQEPPLGIVLGPAGSLIGIQDLFNCHQVIAWGYDLDDDLNLVIHIYDPDNKGDANTIGLNIAHPSDSTPLAVSNWGGTYRGFFRATYSYHNPQTPVSVSAPFVGLVVASPGITSAGPITLPIASLRTFLSLNKIPLASAGSLRNTLPPFASGQGLRKIMTANRAGIGSSSASAAATAAVNSLEKELGKTGLFG